MKNSIKFCTLLLSIFLLASCNYEFKINGDIKNLEDQLVTVAKETEEGMKVIDSTYSKDGKFTLKGKLDYSDFVTVSFEKQNEPIMFYLDNSSVDLKSEVGKLSEAEISGSKAYDFYKKLNNAEKELSEKFKSMEMAFSEAVNAQDTAAIKNIQEQAYEVNKRAADNAFKTINEKPSELISIYTFSRWLRFFSAEQIAEFYNKVSSKIKEDYRLKAFNSQVDEFIKLSKGNDAPDFILSSVDSTRTYTKEDLKGKKTAIYVTDGSRDKDAQITKLLLDNKDAKNINVMHIFFVEYDNTPAKKYIEQHKLENEINTLGNQDFLVQYKISESKVFLLDENGKIIGSESDVTKIQDLL